MEGEARSRPQPPPPPTPPRMGPPHRPTDPRRCRSLLLPQPPEFAAEALDRLAGRADDFLLEAIPQPVRDYLDAAGAPMEEGEVGSVDDATIDRVEKWLRRSPYELKKVSSPLAAIAAAAPVALFQVQNTDEASDPDLVKACLEALENKKKADKKPVSVTSTHKRPRAYAPLTKRARKY